MSREERDGRDEIAEDIRQLLLRNTSVLAVSAAVYHDAEDEEDGEETNSSWMYFTVSGGPHGIGYRVAVTNDPLWQDEYEVEQPAGNEGSEER